jgi:RNA polymerase sigma-70 factor, ECF subfamily
MLSDKTLINKAKSGCKESLSTIYRDYADNMLTLANALLNDISSAEDVVHDVFVKFAESLVDFKLKKSLKAYFVTATCNLARDRLRTKKRHSEKLTNICQNTDQHITPATQTQQTESAQLLRNAIQQLPIDQRETILLKEHSSLTFKQIAQMQNVSINTVQGRYRYGINKLRSILNGEAQL